MGDMEIKHTKLGVVFQWKCCHNQDANKDAKANGFGNSNGETEQTGSAVAYNYTNGDRTTRINFDFDADRNSDRDASAD